MEKCDIWLHYAFGRLKARPFDTGWRRVGSLLHLVLEWLEESRRGSRRVNQYTAQHAVDVSHLKVTPKFIKVCSHLTFTFR